MCGNITITTTIIIMIIIIIAFVVVVVIIITHHPHHHPVIAGAGLSARSFPLPSWAYVLPTGNPVIGDTKGTPQTNTCWQLELQTVRAHARRVWQLANFRR